MSSNLILAFDTASDNIALAVGRSDGLTASNDHPAMRQANVQLVPSINVLFEQDGLSKANISTVVCGLGPGSFTGVRIGVATAKGIARGLSVPLYGVSTLDAVAWSAWKAGIRGKLGVVADAMRGEVYPARFDLTDAGAARLDSHTVAKADVVAESWLHENEQMLLVGDGLKKYAELFSDAESSQFELGDPELWVPKGEGLLLAFEDDCVKGKQGTGDAATLLPIYTRLSDAEENERKRLASGGQIAQGALVDVPKSGVADPARLDEISYRPMAMADVTLVALLESASFSATSAISGECWSESLFADELGKKDRTWWVAYVGDQLVGFAGGWVVDGDIQILDVAIAATHKRRGIAYELLERVMKDGQDLGALTASLEVRESNKAAIALYEQLGFDRLGLRPNYYSPATAGDDTQREAAVVMQKSLTAELSPCHGTTIIPAKAGNHDCMNHAAMDSRLCGNDREGYVDGKNGHPAPPDDVAAHYHPTILGIETSCDETAAAVINGEGKLLSNTIASQIDFHARFGGVVPEIASRKHTEAIVGVVDTALEQASISSWQQLDALAVTYAPGLIGALVVGVAFAKGLSWATDLPLIRVNHLEGHIYANRFVDDKAASDSLKPPFIIALLSGGHTMLVHVCGWGDYHILGQSLDDAAGETFDKVAKALGLGYPGGPIISNLAAQGNPKAIIFPRALLHSHDYQFSLSGLKTAVITYIRKEQEAGSDMNVNDVAASFQQAVIDVQVVKGLKALEETGCTTFCMGGGVAANRALREAYKQAMEAKGINVIYPPANACTDNAAMIALVAIDRYLDKNFMNPDGDAHAQADLEQAY